MLYLFAVFLEYRIYSLKLPTWNKRPPWRWKKLISTQPRISAHPQKVLFKRPTSNQCPLPQKKKNNKVHKRNTGIDYYGISLMAYNV